MQLNRHNHVAAVDGKNFTLQDYLEILWRRKWWLVLPLLVGTAIAFALSYTIAPVYRSSTLILVEPQKVPQSYVSSTVTSSVEERLNTISQQILSRTNLEKIIRQFRLYQPRAVAVPSRQNIAARLRNKAEKILASFGLYKPSDMPAWEPARYVERMRQAVEINVVGRRKNSAFTIAYSGTEPETVKRVTDALASLFIEENLKVREQQAEGTSQFLASELAMAERELQKLEQNLKEFKAKHNGALPEQLNTNLRTLDRLQLELQTISDTLRNAEERKIFYTQQLENDTPTTLPNTASRPTKTPLETELEELKRQLARLQAQFQDSYPDIAIIKNRIKELGEQLVGVQPQKAPTENQSPVRSQRASNFQAQLSLLEAEIQTLKERQSRVRSLIAEHERRIEETYDNELKLFTLTRDYNISKRSYEELLSKSLSAKRAENLEKRQKGEQFKILDPANMPRKPYKPNRPKIWLFGMMVSGAVGAGLIFLLEYFHPYLRKPEDLQRTFELSTLATIPRHGVAQKPKDGRLIAVEEPHSIVTEQYRILYTKLTDRHMGKDQKIFAISSALSGEGKTVTTLNLAVVIARDFGKKTLLLEGDFRAPSIAHYLKVELESDLVDLLTSKTDVRSTLIPFADTLIPFADENLSVLPVHKSVQNASGLLSSQHMRELLSLLKEQYDCILIDTPPVLHLSDMNVFEEVVDGIIMVVRAEKTPRDALPKALEALATDKLVGIVLNDGQQPLAGYGYPYTDMKV